MTDRSLLYPELVSAHSDLRLGAGRELALAGRRTREKGSGWMPPSGYTGLGITGLPRYGPPGFHAAENAAALLVRGTSSR